MYADLHMHLYGCIPAATLLEIGKTNPAVKWERFLPDFEKAFGWKPDQENFFTDYSDPEKFKEIYLFNHPGPFAQFQARFNLVIALSRFDEEEIRKLALQILSVHLTDGVSFGEYRIMYSPFESDEGYAIKTIAACEGLALAESALKNKIQGRLSLSLHRSGDFLHKYELVRELMATNSLVNKYLTSVDFCNMEEGDPPSGKVPFFNRILADNRLNPASALAILYHVGESFTDKSPKSAARWVIESALGGVHRLGHCIALGLAPEVYLHQKVHETAQERIDELKFELGHYEALKTLGEIKPRSTLEKELKELCSVNPEQIIEIEIDETGCAELNTIQEFGMNVLADRGSVIESCPTSNYYIGAIRDAAHHPVKRFADRGLNLTIGTDDPGIFGTDIKNEYLKAQETGISPHKLEQIRINSFNYRSELLSGRM